MTPDFRSLHHPLMSGADLRANWQYDLAAGVVVFLVALPLCLGIALASGAPIFSGIVSGIVGGMVVSLISGSALSVSGPAAGLTVVVLSGISTAGSYSAFLAAGLVCGLVQISMGLFRLGKVSSFFPSSVIKGMLAAIGIIIILKQIPHALGISEDFSVEETFFRAMDQAGPFSEVLRTLPEFKPNAIVVSVLSFTILLFWSSNFAEKRKWIKFLPAPLIAVVTSAVLNELMGVFLPEWKITAETGALVQIPLLLREADSLSEVFHSVEFSALMRPEIITLGVSMALIASLESLLSLEAVDRLDPQRRISPTNRELIAQGVGNGVAAMLGGLPLTAVIVRSSANVYAGARTRLSSFIHGVLLLLAVLLIPTLLNKIPLAALATVLVMVGYKLSSFQLFKSMYMEGWDQFLPFITTTVTIIFSDILIGVAIGWVIAMAFVLKSSSHTVFTMVAEDSGILIRFRKDVSFLNKPRLRAMLDQIPHSKTVYVDGSRAMFIDQDILDLLRDFQKTATLKGIEVYLHNLEGKSYSVQNRRLLGVDLDRFTWRK